MGVDDRLRTVDAWLTSEVAVSLAFDPSCVRLVGVGPGPGVGPVFSGCR